MTTAQDDHIRNHQKMGKMQENVGGRYREMTFDETSGEKQDIQYKRH
jgi:hypothetical protein